LIAGDRPPLARIGHIAQVTSRGIGSRNVTTMASDTAANATALASPEHLDAADVQRRLKAIFISSVGKLVEWYDLYAYAAFALYFAGAFFPNSDPATQRYGAICGGISDATTGRGSPLPPPSCDATCMKPIPSRPRKIGTSKQSVEDLSPQS
jgi:hypothetical protein